MKIEVYYEYMPERSNPEDFQFFYKYIVKFTNNTDDRLKIKSRVFKINNNGKKYEVSGNGVLGEEPWINPYSIYEYVSFMPLHTPTGNMRGYYTFCDDYGNISTAEFPLTFFKR